MLEGRKFPNHSFLLWLFLIQMIVFIFVLYTPEYEANAFGSVPISFDWVRIRWFSCSHTIWTSCGTPISPPWALLPFSPNPFYSFWTPSPLSQSTSGSTTTPPTSLNSPFPLFHIFIGIFLFLSTSSSSTTSTPPSPPFPSPTSF